MKESYLQGGKLREEEEEEERGSRLERKEKKESGWRNEGRRYTGFSSAPAFISPSLMPDEIRFTSSDYFKVREDLEGYRNGMDLLMIAKLHKIGHYYRKGSMQ